MEAPKITKESLRPFIVKEGERIKKMLYEARMKFMERYNANNEYEKMYERFGRPEKDPDKFFDEFNLIAEKKSKLPASVRYTLEKVLNDVLYEFRLDYLRRVEEEKKQEAEAAADVDVKPIGE